MKNKYLKKAGCFLLLFAGLCGAFFIAPAAFAQSDNFPVVIYTTNNPPATPALTDLLLTNQITQQGITWTFSQPQRVGRFVNGDYYVVGNTTITSISPPATNGYNGSMMNIQVNINRSGFDSRIMSGRYDATLRVNPPISLTPGNKLVSSRSAASNLPFVFRPSETSDSPVASISILTCVSAPLPPDAFRPSYAKGSTNIYLSRNMQRQLLPNLAPVGNIPPLSEFEGYFQRPWVDSVFFYFDCPAEYMASYGREQGFMMGFAGLLLTLNFTQAQKEPLLVYLTQYGIDLFGLVQQGHTGWPAYGGYGMGRKYPILLAGIMLNQTNMTGVQSQFGEDQQTIWITETLPVGTYKKSWHTHPQTVVYGGHVGVDGESVNPGWGPYEHLAPSNWVNTIGEEYRRCCTSVSFPGMALAARLIPGMQADWNHPQFFAYCDRWMFIPDDPNDLAITQSQGGVSFGSDLYQLQTAEVLSGGGYSKPYVNFEDQMWAGYRNTPAISGVQQSSNTFGFFVHNLNPNKTNYVQRRTNLVIGTWTTIATNVSGAWSSLSTNASGNLTNITGTNSFTFQDLHATNTRSYYRIVQRP